MDGLKVLYFIWEGLSDLLRALSMSGAAGNAAAFFLYGCISLLPVLALPVILKKQKRSFQGADVWLLVLSAYTFYLLYAFINPALLVRRLPEGLAGTEVLPLVKACYAGLWLSILAAWLLFTLNRILNSKEISDRRKFLCRGMNGLLAAAMLLSILAALYSSGTELWTGIRGLSENESRTQADLFFLFLNAAVSLIPAGFLAAILNQIRRLLKVMQAMPFGEEETEAAKKLTGISTAAITASILCCLVWNGALFFCAGMLTQINYYWEISLFPILTAFASLILARYLKAAGELKQDNEMII